MFLFLGVCCIVLGRANARLRFDERYINRGRGMHELTTVKEYKFKQGFEATLHFVSDSENKTYGLDVSPLHLVVK